jgi:hypothetical protein
MTGDSRFQIKPHRQKAHCAPRPPRCRGKRLPGLVATPSPRIVATINSTGRTPDHIRDVTLNHNTSKSRSGFSSGLSAGGRVWKKMRLEIRGDAADFVGRSRKCSILPLFLASSAKKRLRLHPQTYEGPLTSHGVAAARQELPEAEHLLGAPKDGLDRRPPVRPLRASPSCVRSRCALTSTDVGWHRPTVPGYGRQTSDSLLARIAHRPGEGLAPEL